MDPQEITNESLSNMTDEQIEALDFSLWGEDAGPEGQEQEQEQEAQHEPPQEGDESQQTEAEESTGPEEQEENLDQPEVTDPENGDTPATTEENPEEESEENPEKKEEDDDYKGMVEELFKPFRANNRDIQVQSVDEAKRLMSMGANYNKKMQALNPHLKTLKTLEKHELLDENKLNFAIALMNKEPKAIQKLLADGNINPLDIDTQEDLSEYQPQNYAVSDTDVAMDQVLEELKDSPTFAKTVNAITKELDQNSRAQLKQRPDVIRVLDTHMSNGIYDRVQTEIERRKMFGTLPQGMSDLDAYGLVGNEMFQSGAFNESPPAQEPQLNQTTEQSEQEAKAERQRKERAKPPRGKKAKQASITDLDPLNMSDDEVLAACEKFGIR